MGMGMGMGMGMNFCLGLDLGRRVICHAPPRGSFHKNLDGRCVLGLIVNDIIDKGTI